MVNATGPDTIRLLPPLTVSDEEIDEALRRIGAAAVPPEVAVVLGHVDSHHRAFAGPNKEVPVVTYSSWWPATATPPGAISVSGSISVFEPFLTRQSAPTGGGAPGSSAASRPSLAISSTYSSLCFPNAMSITDVKPFATVRHAPL